MVQILPRTQPTVGERLAGGIDRGFEKGSQLAQAAFESRLTQKAKDAERGRKLSGLDDLKKSSYWQNASELEKAVLEREILGDISAQTSKSLINLQREKAANDVLAELMGQTQRPEQEISELDSSSVGEEMMEPSPKRQIQKEIDKWEKFLTSPNEKLAKVASNKIADLRKQQEFEFKTGKEQKRSEEVLRAETLPIRKEFLDKARAAQQGIENKQRLIERVRTGKIDDPTRAILLQALPFRLGERMLSPESVEYRAGMIDEFKDLRTIFQGQTRIKEIELLEDKVAGLYLTDEQKIGMLNSRMDALQADVIRGEAAAELETEGKFGGPLQFQKMVEEKAKPKLEALFNRILDQQQAVIRDAENLKKIPLDINNPEHIAIVDQILAEAGGDYREAEKIAKERGYKF